jgi:hypothetical protein
VGGGRNWRVGGEGIGDRGENKGRQGRGEGVVVSGIPAPFGLISHDAAWFVLKLWSPNY